MKMLGWQKNAVQIAACIDNALIESLQMSSLMILSTVSNPQLKVVAYGSGLEEAGHM